MKKYIAIILSCLLAFTSCDEWLTATSSTTLPAEELFSTPEGYYNALTGVYLLMTDANLYGSKMTCTSADLSAVSYVLSNESAARQFQEHTYTGSYAKSYIKSMWTHEYKAIANVNMILRQLDENPDALRSDAERTLFKGELLGLRAFLHFDLLRFWGLGSWTGDNASKLTVPYVTTYGKDATVQKSYSETAVLLENDILEAIKALKNDPVTGWTDDEFETVCNAEGYWDNRARHMNLYAVELLAARFYLWSGDEENAKYYAQDIIDNVFNNGFVTWADAEELLLPKSDATEIDWTLSTEHLFSLDCQSMSTNAAMFYSDLTLSGLFLDEDYINTTLFPSTDPETGSVAGAEDIRGTALMLKQSGTGFMNYKLYTTSTNTRSFANLMPLMRVSEAYYILAECAMDAGDAENAVTCLNEVRRHRGISDTLPATVDVETELEKEYYREFINEGQILPFKKRKGLEDGLMWPYPQDETNYGRVQEQ